MITLDSKATIEKRFLTKQQISMLKNFFTIPNPKFFKLENLGKATWATPKKFHYYQESNNYIKIPLGGAQRIGNILNKKINIIDNRFENPKKIKINFKGNLRDYQEKAVEALMTHTVGTLQATTGSGKTIIAINAICKRKQPTLFLVNTVELANQFIQRLKQFTDISVNNVGTIGNGKYEIRDVSVGILQTITKLSDEKINEINKYFGQVFVDEV